jgi:hypothetical protein
MQNPILNSVKVFLDMSTGLSHIFWDNTQIRSSFFWIDRFVIDFLGQQGAEKSKPKSLEKKHPRVSWRAAACLLAGDGVSGLLLEQS